MHSPEPREVEARGQPALCAVQTVTELVHLETGCLPKEGSTALSDSTSLRPGNGKRWHKVTSSCTT